MKEQLCVSHSSMNDKVALVTGAGSGIGRAIACQLAGNDFHVFLVGPHETSLGETKRLIEEKGKTAYIIVADLRSVDDIAMVKTSIERKYQHLNVLVNNAGMAMEGDYRQFNHDDVLNVFNLNAVAPFTLTNLLINLLENAEKANVVNVSSEASLEPGPEKIVYGASKSALNYISNAFSRSLAKSKIRVNVIAPGAVDTKMLHMVLAGKEFVPPIGRLITTDEIAEWAMMIIQSDVMTGAFVTVDGGTSLLPLQY